MQPARIVNDFSSRDRVGLAGSAAGAVLQSLSLSLPSKTFHCIEQTDGSLLVRLAATDFLWLSPVPAQKPLTTRTAAIAESAECYRLHWRSSHAWLAVEGDSGPPLLSEACALDIKRVANLTCAATMLGRIPVLLLRWDMQGTLCLHLLVPKPHAAAVTYYLKQRQDDLTTHA
jgi:hypothetical protein